MWVGLVLLIRLVVLSAERVFFHRLGKAASPLPTMVIAYGGAAVILWLAAGLWGQWEWISESMGSALVYAASFGCYTVSLVKGPVSTVSAWSNAAVILLFLAHPNPSLLAWLGVAVFAAGMVGLLSVGDRFLSSGVIWMLLADVFLVGGRLLDAHHGGTGAAISYAASLMTGVSVAMGAAYVLFNRQETVRDLIVTRPAWAILSAGFNAGAYLTLVVLIRELPPFVVEAVSSLAGIGATVLGIFWLGERRRALSKLVAAGLMTLGAIGVLTDHLGWITVQWW